MSQSAIVAGVVCGAFVLFLAKQDRIKTYLGFLWG